MPYVKPYFPYVVFVGTADEPKSGKKASNTLLPNANTIWLWRWRC